MVYMYAYLNTLVLLHCAFMLCLVKMLLKGEVGGSALNSHGNDIVDHGKSWNYDFEFLWEPYNYAYFSFPSHLINQYLIMEELKVMFRYYFSQICQNYMSRQIRFPKCGIRERSGSVVECLT